MNDNYFIFQYEDNSSTSNLGLITVVFINQQEISRKNSFSQEVSRFFEQKALSDKIVVIWGEYLEKESKDFILKTPEEAFERIPGKSKDFFDENLLIYSFDSDGNLNLVQGKKPKNEIDFLNYLYRNGSTILFKKNGGIVESTPDHHFVFPSGKHCSKFLRTGNVLKNHPEIFFLAIQLLPKMEDVNYIYCDTASINVLPYTLFELKRRFGPGFICPTVYSFESYEYFEKRSSSFPDDSLLLISSSTSGGIIERLLEKGVVQKSQICLLYFLGNQKDFKSHQEQILCNLSNDTNFKIGLDEIPSSKKGKPCLLCQNNSRPIPIVGDVFLTIQPQVKLQTLSIKSECTPKYISEFVEKFIGGGKEEKTILKVYNKDDKNGKENYEIYIDYAKLILNINEPEFEDYKKSLDKCIDKNIPANTKFLLTLPDIGSEELAKYILDQTQWKNPPETLNFSNDWEKGLNGKQGTVVIIASCISSGKKLLQISRLMRKFPDLSLVYFIGIYRPSNSIYSKTLESNLSKGSTIRDSSPMVTVERVLCSNEKKNTSWEEELNFINEALSNLDEEEKLYIYFDERRNNLLNNKASKGLFNNVFLKTVKGNDLFLNRNFAFWKFDYDENEVSQSECYFQISGIINNLKNRAITDPPSLSQTNYVRNLLDPGNFSRFNDAIIQSALLRAGDTAYFAYDIDKQASLEMKEQLLSMLEKIDTDDADALPEFLLAICLKKLKLNDDDLKEFLLKTIECDNEIISGFATIIYNERYEP